MQGSGQGITSQMSPKIQEEIIIQYQHDQGPTARSFKWSWLAIIIAIEEQDDSSYVYILWHANWITVWLIY